MLLKYENALERLGSINLRTLQVNKYDRPQVYEAVSTPRLLPQPLQKKHQIKLKSLIKKYNLHLHYCDAAQFSNISLEIFGYFYWHAQNNDHFVKNPHGKLC